MCGADSLEEGKIAECIGGAWPGGAHEGLCSGNAMGGGGGGGPWPWLEMMAGSTRSTSAAWYFRLSLPGKEGGGRWLILGAIPEGLEASW